MEEGGNLLGLEQVGYTAESQLSMSSDDPEEKERPVLKVEMSNVERAQLAAAIAAFDRRLRDSSIETWPVGDLVRLSKREAFLGGPPYTGLVSATLKDSWETHQRVVGTSLSPSAFIVFRNHVMSFPGCKARRVKLSQAQMNKYGPRNTAEPVYYTEVLAGAPR